MVYILKVGEYGLYTKGMGDMVYILKVGGYGLYTKGRGIWYRQTFDCGILGQLRTIFNQESEQRSELSCFLSVVYFP